VRAQNRTEPNPWGFVPVVHFRNEAEEEQLFGASDLEPVEPFMKAHHDTMIFAVQGITAPLELILYCIVDVSETPEFAFGTAVQSSKASVSEQMVPLARKIRRKRGQFEE
jgi:hypothetical protein